MLKFLNGPAADKANGLMIRRAPLFLRVTCKQGRGGTRPTGEWDALDQVFDEATPNETLYAYRLVKNEGWIHVCGTKNGKRWGGMGQRATYEFVEPQPDDATMRNNAKWQAWAKAKAEEDAGQKDN